MSASSSLERWPTPAADAWRIGLGAVHVWRGRVTELGACVPRLQRLLSPDEREQRSGFALSRGVLRALLGVYMGVDGAELKLRLLDHGKPVLAAPYAAAGLHFNVSHSDEWLLWAISRGHALGVDVERERPVARQAAIAQQFFSPSEQQAMQDVPVPLRQRRFFELWTCKEAWAKAVGLGVFAGMGQVEVHISASGCPRVVYPPGREPALPPTLHWLDVAPGYAAALAAQGDVPPPRLWTLDGNELDRLLQAHAPPLAAPSKSLPRPSTLSPSRPGVLA
jgi:4'-phosphopantetheinyl transferase